MLRTSLLWIRPPGVWLIRLDAKTKRLAEQLQCSARSGSARMYGIDSRFMAANLKCRRSENKTMPIIAGPLGCVDIGSIVSSGFVGNEAVIDVQLDFYPYGAMPFIHCPARHGVLFSSSQDATQIP